MARVKIVDVLEHLDQDLRYALQRALAQEAPESNIDARALWRRFLRATNNRCSTWERVPDRYVQQ